MASIASIAISFLIAASITAVNCNIEVDILNAWKNNLTDPNNVLQSWDPTLMNPCTYFHVTCNLNNSVTRLDLGNAGLSGPLIPELAQFTNLQYLEVAENKLSGVIPEELGNLSKLVGLGLHHNNFTGPIPSSFVNLKSLRFVRLNSNKLSGIVPREIFDLARVGSLQLLNVSDNNFTGTYHPANVSGYVVTSIIQDPKL